MASFTERIRLIFDVDSKGATTGFGNFSKSVKEADGLTGKFKAGAKSLGEGLRANVGMAALGAGTALVAFGVKAVQAFQDTAKAALNLSKATGLSVEQASRWIAVGDDFGVTAEELTTGIGKIAKSLDGAKWEKYGISIRDASGQARATDHILLDAFDTLGKITNQTERAKVGNELFGKGYANMAPLIGKSRTELEKMLSTVEDGQVITSQEARQAEEMRLAWDKLSDAIGEFALAFGSAVSSISPLVEVAATALNVVAVGLDRTIGGVKKFVSWLNPWDSGQKEVTTSAAPLAAAIDEVGDAAGTAAEKAEALYSALTKHITSKDDVEGSFHAYASAIDTLNTAFDDPDTVVDEYARALLGVKEAAWQHSLNVAKAAEATALANGEQWDATDSAKAQRDALSELAVWLEPGSPLRKGLDAYIWTLNQIPAVKQTTVRINGERVAASPTDPTKPFGYGVVAPGYFYNSNTGKTEKLPAQVAAPFAGFAAGTSSAPSGPIVVGERGPEVITGVGGRGIIPNHQLGGVTNNITIHAGLGADGNEIGRQVNDALAQFYRNGGQRA